MPDGTLDSKEEGILQEITEWMDIHGDAIFSTRPWKVFGEGPSANAGNILNERTIKPFTAADIRFTSKGDKLFVFVLGSPESSISVHSIGSSAGLFTRKISRVRVLGSDEQISWSLGPRELRIEKPKVQPNPYTLCFEIS